jgi:hypothetical protein
VNRPSGFPSLYQVNVRVWLNELSRELRRPATLDDIPSSRWSALAVAGFQWVWLLGIWQTGAAGREISQSKSEWREAYMESLPDVVDSDICGSPFAIASYSVNIEYGGNAALERVRARLRECGMQLLLDFVPNHTARDHPWVQDHPDYYIRSTRERLRQEPQNFCELETGAGIQVMAYGRDPYFAGWPDTLQLNYGNPELHAAMKQELERISEQCDGVRCDMAMLILPDVFRQTWNVDSADFWSGAIESVRRRFPNFKFIAEVYWGRESELQASGFDFAYDKTLYDRLCRREASAIFDHLQAPIQYQRKLVRFLENHDEPRAAAVFPPEVHKPAAVLTYLTPGLKLFHDGQFEGRKRKVSIHLCRRASEALDPAIRDFYSRLRECISLVENHDWQLLQAIPAWEGNWTWRCFLAFAWKQNDLRLLVAVNLASNQSQCYLRLPFPELNEKTIALHDRMGPYRYDRNGSELYSRGLYLDMPEWGYHIFDVFTSV